MEHLALIVLYIIAAFGAYVALFLTSYTNMKSHVCSLCNKGFVDERDFNSHEPACKARRAKGRERFPKAA